jgi:(p)ppGpp synthase/HD superfamily hydrolase
VVDIVRGLTRQYAHAQDRFNPAISLPHPPSAGSRAERKKIELRYLSGQSPSAKLIKAYDRMDNLRDILHAGRDFARLYARETIDLVEVLAPHIPFDLSLHLKEKSEKILHLVDQPAQCPTVDVEAMRIVYDHRED